MWLTHRLQAIRGRPREEEESAHGWDVAALVFVVMRREVSLFDEQPLPGLDSEVPDFRAASEFFAPIRKLTPHIASSAQSVRRRHAERVEPSLAKTPESGPRRVR